MMRGGGADGGGVCTQREGSTEVAEKKSNGKEIC